MRAAFKIGSVALAATRIWQDFSLILILVSPWLFKLLLVAVSQRVSGSPIISGRDLNAGSPLGDIELILRNFCGTFEDGFFPPVPQLITKYLFLGQCLNDGPLAR